MGHVAVAGLLHAGLGVVFLAWLGGVGYVLRIFFNFLRSFV